MLDIFNWNEFNYPEMYWFSQVTCWSMSYEQGWFYENMLDWEKNNK